MKLIRSYILIFENFLIFIATVIVLYPLSFIISVEKLESVVKLIFRFMLKINHIKTEVKGLEQLDSKKSYIFIPNHQSFFDAILLSAKIPNFIRGLEIAEHFKWPVYGPFIKRFGNIPIDQKSVKSSLASFNRAKELMTGGKSIIVFPEGQRTPDGKVGSFKRLPFMFAKESQLEIVPVAIIGLYEIMPAGSKYIKPGKAALIIGKPISYSEYKDIDTKLLADQVRNTVIELSLSLKF